MFKVDKVANKLGNNISKELNFDGDKRDVIVYGIFAILQITLSIVITSVFGLFLGVLLESLIVSFATAILRKYSGGAHANTPGKCIVIGTIVCVLPTFLITKLIYDFNIYIVSLIGIIIFIGTYYLIYMFAPVDSVAKPIRNQDKRKKLKKGSILILSVYLVIVICLILSYKVTLNNKYLIYAICMYIGIAWQAFTLTNASHFILKK
ncbi:accessory gene regulator ArgB-like protein [Clostridium cylindrosporum]|uniref:Putative accessory gene regulator protein B n=1 Tax=Clostridium cylindrosporum DSM 605 TaxID=1121307 RepID=A0A0J8DG27_CLOCY|nr:accessory gene regulator B family protein [Clostridium cylindrosporum]KMT23189.1 putative accessory gene regulator protein B [Clostridium cylindrosporum DSM 605]